jgi:redox-sensitive bicupin YhaK (pirin superfamily)
MPGGGTAKVIAGAVEVDEVSTVGPIKGVTTDPTYLDIVLPAGARFSHPINSEYGAFVYPHEGRVDVGPSASARALNSNSAGVLACRRRRNSQCPLRSKAGVEDFMPSTRHRCAQHGARFCR